MQEFNISDIRIHPNFNNATLVNDIALLKLERPAKRQQNIDVVCVASAASLEVARVSRCYVTGWGRRSETSEHSVVLKVILLSDWSPYSILTSDWCRRSRCRCGSRSGAARRCSSSSATPTRCPPPRCVPGPRAGTPAM